jgi:hypothetical protein
MDEVSCCLSGAKMPLLLMDCFIFPAFLVLFPFPEQLEDY